MFPSFWYLQSAVGFEYQGKTEKHASQRGELRRGQEGCAVSPCWGRERYDRR